MDSLFKWCGCVVLLSATITIAMAWFFVGCLIFLKTNYYVAEYFHARRMIRRWNKAVARRGAPRYTADEWLHHIVCSALKSTKD